MKSKQLNIKGMTCMSCVSTVEKALYSLAGVEQVSIDLEHNSGTIKGSELPSDEDLAKAVSASGDYQLTISDATVEAAEVSTSTKSSYKPLFLVAAYLIGVTVITELSSGLFLMETWMPNFMAGFFLTFSFFKMLDIKGFAKAYKTYDLIAARSSVYAYAFPFIELGLGLAYLLFPDNPLTHLITAIIMFVSLVGVIIAVTNKKQIQCACLGTVFNLPMSSVTIIEDGIMLIMAVLMYITTL